MRDAVEERRKSLNPLDRLKNSKKEQVSSDEQKEETVEPEETVNPATQPEVDNGINHSTEQGAE